MQHGTVDAHDNVFKIAAIVSVLRDRYFGLALDRHDTKCSVAGPPR
jgi:hypothetical protein